MPVIIGHTTPFGAPETEKQIELRRVRKVVYDVIRDFCARRGKPLTASIHAPAHLRQRRIDYRDPVPQPICRTAGSVPSTDVMSGSLTSLETPQTTSSGYTQTASASGTNPAAPEFSPSVGPDSNSSTTPTGSPVPRGIRSPEEFLKSFKAVSASGFNLGGQKAVPRRIAFKNVPRWASYSDILGLVHGAAVDRIFPAAEGEFIVQFCDEASCEQYANAYPSGIRVEDDVIEVARAPGSEKITPAFTSMIENGASRLVRLSNVPLSKTLEELHGLAEGLNVDHILYNALVGCPGSVYFFFCGIAHGNQFLNKLQEERPWDDCEVDFMPDPCQTATTFHGNTISYQMSIAEAA